MEEIIFKSSLSQQEMEDNFAGFNFFDGLMESLTEVLAYSKEEHTILDQNKR